MKQHSFAIGILLITLILVACQPALVPAGPSPISVGPSGTAAPAIATPAGSPATLTVLAAASLTDSFKEIGGAFEHANPGVKVSFSFAGSQALRTQIQQGARADIFASADSNNMDPLKADNLLANAPQVFTRNVLTVIVPRANPGGLKQLKDLSKPGLKLIVADTGVPAGNYTLQVLDKLSADPAYGTDFKRQVLANVVSKETDVKAVVSKVSLGEADGGVAYTTDARAAADKLSTISIPDQYNVIATYPIAVLKTSANIMLAQKLVDFILGADGQAVLNKYGFSALSQGG